MTKCKINTILYCTIGLSIAVLLTVYIGSDLQFDRRSLQQTSYSSQPASYGFSKPSIAKKVLSLLDVFTPLDEKYFTNKRGDSKKNYNKPFYGLKVDEDYCEKVRAHFVNHPESVFDEANIFTVRPPTALIRRKVVPALGNDPMPHVGSHMGKANTQKHLYIQKRNISVFFTATSMYESREIGSQFSCLSQASNHIPGHDTLNRKDFVAENVINYAKKFQDRPQCFSYDKFFPETWVLYNKEDCDAFFKVFNSEQYQAMKKEKRIVYIRKVGSGSHRGQGVQPVNDDEEADIRAIYANGAKCGIVKKNYIIQDYVANPLLLNGRKFDFRMYLLVASSNPLMAFYHDGFLRVSLSSYDVNSDDKSVLMTNLALSGHYYDQAKEGNLHEGMDEESLKIAQQWSFERLHAYLVEKKIVTDPNWLDNHLRPEFKKAMVHLLRLGSHSWWRDSSLYELYGVDFMLDTNLNLWFLEANSGPGLDGYSVPMEKFITKMLTDHFEIVLGLLKSRMKRVVFYVSDLIETGGINKLSNGEIEIPNLEARRAEFKDVIKNYFEKEYEPKPDNGFSKIMDENLEGMDRYQGLIAKDCLAY